MTRRELLGCVQTMQTGLHATDDARQLVMHACHISHAELLTHPEQSVSWIERAHAMHLARRRRCSTPIAYLTHQRAFFGRDFFVNKHVLIPRPETEPLIELALPRAAHAKTIVDIGTGSGAIAITIACETQKSVIAIDCSRSALAVAKKNARRHRVEHLVSFLHDKYLNPLNTLASPFLILANLPYLSEAMLRESPEEVRDFEPHVALVGDKNDGLDCYRELFRQIQHRVQEGAWGHCLVEFDPRQEHALVHIVRQLLPTA
ncbi:peptide chain release factor N(5)-glutamine methyltransferase, partial [Candidatus Uhrbacteria bacterium]|nr:peptide chain release factor N(5)-glutamine methyltransferase [Candidatus Uhrbacteria bacterium]